METTEQHISPLTGRPVNPSQARIDASHLAYLMGEATERAALALRAAYAAATPYQFCNHDDYPATCQTCLANARIAVENNTPEWVVERIASYGVTA